ncbi:glycogen synthase, partial [candidate division KSB1 bacterium]|nr:glycogen synthase [candidate division KSB1 bacterium]
MKICFATSECVPYVKTGGLADVGGALPKALSEQGCDVKIFLPLYGSINRLEHDLRVVEEFRDIPQHMGTKLVTFDTWAGKLPDSDVQVYFVDCPEYYYRSKIYTEDPDEDERFILFQRAVLKILQRQQWAPDVVHCNDWETALLPVYLNTNYKGESLFANTATLLAIHNIGYQGIFPKESILKAGLSYDNYYPTGPYEFYDSFCFLKAGIEFSEIISTVSETYAQEIQSSAYGAGLEGVLASRSSDLYGILNGIDPNVWNPKTDQVIPHNFSIRNLTLKKKNKQTLLEYTNLPFDANIPTIGMISRLAEQKGFELLQPVLKELMRLPLQLVVLGSGEKKYED